MEKHDFYDQGVYGWMCHNHPFTTMEQCLMNDIDIASAAFAQNYDLEDYQHHLIMKHNAENYDHNCSICLNEGPPSQYASPPVAQLAEAPDSKPEQSEFESQQEDKIIPSCPSCGMHQTLSIRQVIKQEDYQPISSIYKAADDLIFYVGEPHNGSFLQVLESYLNCSNCLYETAMGDDYAVVPSSYDVF